MLDKIFTHNWMALPATTRQALRTMLNIPKTGQTEVSTTGGNESVLVSDGVTVNDLAFITKEFLVNFLGDKAPKDAEFPQLWSIVVQKADMTLSLSSNVEKSVESVDKTDLGTGDNSAIATKHEEASKEEGSKSEAGSGKAEETPA
jgi:hypothetical protein